MDIFDSYYPVQMKKLTQISAVLIYSLLIPMHGYSCSCCYYTTTFCGAFQGENINPVGLVQVVGLGYDLNNPYQELMYAKVIDDLNGNITQDTITVLGSDGGNCNSSVFFPGNDTLLLKLYEILYYGEIVYSIGGCGVRYLRYEKDTLVGSILPFVNKMSYAEYVSNFSECEASPPYFWIAGRVYSWIDPNIGISELDMKINGFPVETTDSIGGFFFPYVQFEAPNEHQPIAPFSNEDILRGVSVSDVIKIRKHILGMEALDDPRQKIAADINNSQSITTLDLIQLMKVILGQENSFPNNQSWRFTAKNYQFPQPDNPWHENFDAEISLHLCSYDFYHVDLIAIKIGDVDGSYINY
jgi:hypothetical protein